MMTTQPQFLDIKTPHDLAIFLGIPYSTLIYYTYRIDQAKKYHSFTIKKRNGMDRAIVAPCYPLKLIQQRIQQTLQEIYVPRHSSHGFIKNRSILTNSKLHSKRPWILKLDIKDFFPSITYQRVRGLFQSRPFLFSKEVAQILAHLCCYEKKLPQGAPTSPVISNMICVGLDRDLQQLAKRTRSNYTRYADDITFSPSYPHAIHTALGSYENEKPSSIKISNELIAIFQKHSFELNTDKTRLRTSKDRQSVTGIVVNLKPNVRRTYIRRIRAMLHNWKDNGIEEAQNKFSSTLDYDKQRKTSKSFYWHLWGMITFVGNVRGKSDALYIRLVDEFRKNDPNWNKETLTEEQITAAKQLDEQKRILNQLINIMEKIEGLESIVENTREQGHLKEKKELLNKQRRILENQLAKYSSDAPVHKIIELDECNGKIQEINDKLRDLGSIVKAG